MKEKEILRHTSRSFYFTLRVLPRGIRADVSLGYLLARATDTLADSSPAQPARRTALLYSARASLGRPEIAGYAASDWASMQHDPAERRLLEELPALWFRMHRSPDAARARLEVLMSHILEGQIFDLERFAPGAPALTEAELERYTYLVAGCVGEFWTDLCAERLPGFSRDPTDVMRARGRRYGQGLQLVNILRDRRMDAALGRVYVGAVDVPRWTRIASEWLGEGCAYCGTLRSGRLRYATLLPALLGWRTLALAGSHSEEMLAPRKVPRAEARRWMRRALAVWWSPAAAARLAAEARGSTRGQ